jgi:HEAT repeat protein
MNNQNNNLHDAPEIQQLILQLQASDPQLKAAAIAGLESKGTLAITPLCAILTPQNTELHEDILWILSSINMEGDTQVEEAIINLLTLVEDGSERKELARSLGSFGGQKSVQPLIDLLDNDLDRYVRRAASEALGRLEVANAIPRLSQALLADPDVFVRAFAASGLGNFTQAEVIATLLQAQQQETEAVVSQAISQSIQCVTQTPV